MNEKKLLGEAFKSAKRAKRTTPPNSFLRNSKELMDACETGHIMGYCDGYRAAIDNIYKSISLTGKQELHD